MDTEYSADSIETWPRDRDWAVCSTYQVNQRPGSDESAPEYDREGRILLLHVAEGKAKIVEQHETGAILDAKWTGDEIAFGMASGDIRMYRMDGGRLAHVDTAKVSEGLCLSLDWENRVRGGECTQGVVSLSTGEVGLFSKEGMQCERKWAAHGYEAWIAAYEQGHRDIVWSGGDDLTVKVWDTRTECDVPVWSNRRFEGGVTAIESDPHDANLTAVGSYDGTLRMFDRRHAVRPVGEIDLGGGIWRIKWHERERRAAVAGMHAGAFVVAWDGVAWRLQDVFERHESMVYGIDWARRGIVSCSFYDHVVHVW